MSKLPIEYLKHIYDECTFINNSITPGLTKDDLIDNEVLKRAIVRSLEIIGEATKKIPADIKHPSPHAQPQPHLLLQRPGKGIRPGISEPAGAAGLTKGRRCFSNAVCRQVRAGNRLWQRVLDRVHFPNSGVHSGDGYQ